MKLRYALQVYSTVSVNVYAVAFFNVMKQLQHTIGEVPNSIT